MIELTLYKFLTDALAPIKVYMETPDNAPATYVLFEKTGSGGSNYLANSTFAIQSYGKSLFEAAELNAKVKKAMARLVNLDDISKVSLNSDYNYTDTETKRYRYQAVFDVYHY